MRGLADRHAAEAAHDAREIEGVPFVSAQNEWPLLEGGAEQEVMPAALRYAPAGQWAPTPAHRDTQFRRRGSCPRVVPSAAACTAGGTGLLGHLAEQSAMTTRVPVGAAMQNTALVGSRCRAAWRSPT